MLKSGYFWTPKLTCGFGRGCGWFLKVFDSREFRLSQRTTPNQHKMNTKSFVAFLCIALTVVYAKESNKGKARNLKKYIPQWKYCKSKPVDSLALCNSTTKYPEAAIRKLINSHKIKATSQTVIEPVTDLPIAQAKGPEGDAENLCRTRTFTVFPKMALDMNTQKLKYIVNVKDQFEQSVVYETCVDKDNSCFGMNEDTLPAGLKTQCVQKYSSVRLTSVNEQGKLEYGNFLVPSMCVCSYYDYSSWALSRH